MKFVLTGLPQGAQASAFMPHFNRLATAWQMSKGAVTGQPGTQGIPAPTINTTPSPDIGDLALSGTARSVDSPDVWYPSKYYERSLNGDGSMGPVTPVRIYSTNVMPVPAVDPRGIPARLARPVNQRGLQQISQPRALPWWG